MIADAILIVLPLGAFRVLKHNFKNLRRRLQIIFAASALTTVASIVSAAFNFSKESFPLLIASEIEVGVNMFVCSLT
jgi:hypothetical protein